MDKRLRTGIAILIATAWAVSFIIDVVNPNYEPPAAVHALMLLVAGFFFGPNILPPRKNGNNDG